MRNGQRPRRGLEGKVFCLVTLETLRLCQMPLKSSYKGQGRASVAWLKATEATEAWLKVFEVWLGILEALLEEPENWTRVFLALA